MHPTATSAAKSLAARAASATAAASAAAVPCRRRRKTRVAVAVSGGVDSSVALYLLRRRLLLGRHRENVVGSGNDDELFGGYHVDDVVGLHMSNWDASDEGGNVVGRNGVGGNDDDHRGRGAFCERSERDATDARKVCEFLNVEMRRASFAAEYWTDVFVPFLDGLMAGRTANPDVGCNAIVKFGAMKEYAKCVLGADVIATGHYARLWRRDSNERDGTGGAGTGGATVTTPPPDFLAEELAGSPEAEWLGSWGIEGDTSSSLSPLLLAGADRGKDQSYFLSGVTGRAFRDVLFPLGNLTKGRTNETDDDAEASAAANFDAEGIADIADGGALDSVEADPSRMTVREIAASVRLPTATKRDSMGMCFVGKRKSFSDFVSEYLPETPKGGNFVDVDTGEIIGRHRGSALFTIGQGAKIPGASRRWFVCGRDDDDGGGGRGRDTIFVCGDTNHPALYSDDLYVEANAFNWIGGVVPPPLRRGESMTAWCRTRHLQPLIPCDVSWRAEPNLLLIQFDLPVRAVTPGQTAALYVGKHGSVCLGGGPITGRGPTYRERGLDLPLRVHPSGDNDVSARRRERNSDTEDFDFFKVST